MKIAFTWYFWYYIFTFPTMHLNPRPPFPEFKWICYCGFHNHIRCTSHKINKPRHYWNKLMEGLVLKTNWTSELACSNEFGFCVLIMLICWVDRTEWGNIFPWIEDTSFRSSSSLSSRTEDERLRLVDFRLAVFFSLLEISSFTFFFPTCIWQKVSNALRPIIKYFLFRKIIQGQVDNGGLKEEIG